MLLPGAGGAGGGCGPAPSRPAPSSARRRAAATGAGHGQGDHRPLPHARRRTRAGSSARGATGSGIPARSSSSITRCRTSARGARAAQDLADLPADALGRVQRRQRVLEDHRDLVAAKLPAAVPGRPRPGPSPVERDRPGDGRLVGEQADDRHRGHRLAAAGLADQSDGGAGPDVEGHVVDDADRAVRGRADRPTGRPPAGGRPVRTPPAERRPVSTSAAVSCPTGRPWRSPGSPGVGCEAGQALVPGVGELRPSSGTCRPRRPR